MKLVLQIKANTCVTRSNKSESNLINGNVHVGHFHLKTSKLGCEW